MSDAQFVLDVVAQMTGGEQTIAQTDALISKLQAAGVSANDMSVAVVAASNALTASKDAATAANAALAEGNAKYRELEQAANQAAKAQEKSAKLGAVRPEIAAAANAASSALAAHEQELRRLEQAAKAATAKETELGVSLGNVKKAASASGAASSEQAAALRKSVKEAEGFVPAAKQLGDFKDALSSSEGRAILLSGAALGAAAAIAAVTLAAVAATVAIAAWAVGLADANRSAALNQQAVEALDPAIAKLSRSYASIAEQTGQTVPQLNALTRALHAAHVSAKAMPEALRAAALAEAALGNGGSAQFLADIQKGKVAVGQLSREVQSKIGGIVAKQMIGITAQSAKLKAEIGSLFGGLNIEPVLAGLQRLVGLFDENTAAGSAIKFLFESVFQPLINQADNAATAIEAFALGFLIGMTKVYIAAKPAIKALSDFFGLHDPSLADTLKAVTKAGEYAAYIFVGFVAALVAIGAAVAVVVVPLIAMQVAVYGMIAALVAAVVYVESAFVNAFVAVFTFLSGLPIKMGQMGADLIAGLVNGITGAAGSVVNAVSGAVDGAITAARNTLGIHSPSTVFAEIGGYTAEGFAEGVDGGAPAAQSALESLADPSAAAASSGGGKASAGGGQPIVDMKGATFVFQGVANAEQAESRFEEMFTRVLEGYALQAEGGAPA